MLGFALGIICMLFAVLFYLEGDGEVFVYAALAIALHLPLDTPFVLLPIHSTSGISCCYD